MQIGKCLMLHQNKPRMREEIAIKLIHPNKVRVFAN